MSVMSRHLADSLDAIKFATEEIRREQWSWHDMRESQKLRWRPDNVSGAGHPSPLPSPVALDVRDSFRFR